VVLLALLGAGGLSCWATEQASTAEFGVSLDAFVHIVIGSVTVSDGDVAQTDLLSRYFLPAGFASFNLTVYAISNYQVTASDTVSVTGDVPGGDYAANGLLEINASAFPTNDETCMVGGVWQEVPVGPTASPTVLTGCNTQGGVSNSSVATLDVRMDLDNLGDSNVDNAFDFIITLTVTDPTS
jgi:hypothetical protein